jgi:ABC-type sugar transport system permease subunit
MSVTDTITRRFDGEGSLVERAGGSLRENWFSYLLFFPTLLYLLFLLWIPFLRGVWMSFHEWQLGGGSEWIGLGHYAYLFGWDPFYTSLKATAVFGMTTFVQVVIAIIAALVIVNITRFKSILSGFFLLPYTMPPVVTGTVWLYMLDPSYGPIMGYAQELGILDSAVFWDVNGTLSLAVVSGVLAWTFWPFMFLIIVATMESIPSSHYETAQIYGANRVQTFLKITLPQLKSAIMVAVTIRMVWNLAKISQPFQITGGGPGYDTSVLGVLLYRFAYEEGRFGLGFAVGMILLIMTIGFVALFIREFERSRSAARGGA